MNRSRYTSTSAAIEAEAHSFSITEHLDRPPGGVEEELIGLLDDRGRLVCNRRFAIVRPLGGPPEGVTGRAPGDANAS